MAEDIQNAEYLRERLHPAPGDLLYLHLSDLRLAIERVRSERAMTLLDYGCGGSPYRSLFKNTDYRRADFLQAPGDRLDYLLGADSRVEERPATFDFILSTQVLEHVIDPAGYFAECYRLLKPGGTLYCTTHGTFEEHGVPHDYQRWTMDGLRRDVTRAGFTVDRIEKHTTGPRAVFFQLDYSLEILRGRKGSKFEIMLGVVRKALRSLRKSLHQACDRHFANCRVADKNLEEHRFYVGLAVLAHKPYQK